MTHTKLIPLTMLIKDLLESHHADTYFGDLVEALETAGEQAHIDDLIFETADNLCPVYYYDLNKWIGEHVEEINDTAREYGIDSVNFDLYKLAQQAWVVTEEGAMREYVEDACLVVALKQLAKDMPKISEETFSELKIALENASPETVGDILDAAETLKKEEEEWKATQRAFFEKVRNAI